MAPNLRSVPQVMPPGATTRAAPQQQGWVWNGSNWVWDPDFCDPCQGFPSFPCPPSGFPTPCPPWFPPPAGQAPWYPGANGGVSFSATPPANPIRGNLWWDGTTLHLFDGAAWVDIGPSAPSSMMGVTNGSNAAPGQIGEFISGSATFNYAAYPNLTQVTVSPIVVQPGDWHLWAWAGFSGFVGPAEFYLNTVPPTMSNNMAAFASGYSPITGVVEEALILLCPAAQGNFSLPTVLVFSVVIDHRNGTTLPAGSGTLIVQGRRMR